MTRWEERWRLAGDAAEDADRMQAPVVAVAVDGDHAAVLDVEGGAARLSLLRRGADGFEPWSEPVIEPLKFMMQMSTSAREWTVGPVQVIERRLAVWAVAGACVDPPTRIGVRVGSRSRTFAVRGGHFAAVITRVPGDTDEIVLFGAGPDGARPLWSLSLSAANRLSDEY